MKTESFDKNTLLDTLSDLEAATSEGEFALLRQEIA